jgi:DNA adenine methylase
VQLPTAGAAMSESNHNLSSTSPTSRKTSGKLVNRKQRTKNRIANSKNSTTTTGSVLRFAGGKSKATLVLSPFVAQTVTEVVAPFVGGASFELFLAQARNIRVFAYDLFEPLINFWQCLKENPTKLVEQIKLLHPLNKENFYKLRQYCVSGSAGSNNNASASDVSNSNRQASASERAAAFFAVNRSSFSGTTCSGGYSAESAEKRFTASSIEKLLHIDLRNISFACADFEQSISKHPQSFLFLDPPYALEPKKSKLYGKSGDLHDKFDHARLLRVLQNHSAPWLLCYNNSDSIKAMYSQYTIHDVKWSYSMSADKTSKEVVITSCASNTASAV